MLFLWPNWCRVALGLWKNWLIVVSQELCYMCSCVSVWVVYALIRVICHAYFSLVWSPPLKVCALCLGDGGGGWETRELYLVSAERYVKLLAMKDAQMCCFRSYDCSYCGGTEDVHCVLGHYVGFVLVPRALCSLIIHSSLCMTAMEKWSREGDNV